jgi:hypothetical protein
MLKPKCKKRVLKNLILLKEQATAIFPEAARGLTVL